MHPTLVLLALAVPWAPTSESWRHPLSISYVSTRSRRCTALSPYARDSHRARYPGSRLNGRLRSLRMVALSRLES
jgi:hypothetical protein